jgi:hypothetical protein
MNPPEPKAGAGCGVRSLGCLLIAVGLVFFFFLMMVGIGGGLLELGWTLLFGWTGFISRVAPKISWNLGAIITGIVFAVLLGVFAHRFLVWLTRGIAVARGGSFQWQRRWTFCGLLLLVFCFLVGMSIVGAAHQIGWILGSKESLFVDRFGMYGLHDVRTVELAVKEALLDTNSLPELRKKVPALLMSYNGGPSGPPLESVRLLVSLSSSNTVQGVLVFSRDEKVQRSYGANYLTGEDIVSIAPKELQSFIQSNATKLVSF